MTVPAPSPDDAGSQSEATGRGLSRPAGAARDARLAWKIGGSLLVAYAALMLMFGSGQAWIPGSELLLATVWAGACSSSRSASAAPAASSRGVRSVSRHS